MSVNNDMRDYLNRRAKKAIGKPADSIEATSNVAYEIQKQTKAYQDNAAKSAESAKNSQIIALISAAISLLSVVINCLLTLLPKI